MIKSDSETRYGGWLASLEDHLKVILATPANNKEGKQTSTIVAFLIECNSVSYKAYPFLSIERLYSVETKQACKESMDLGCRMEVCLVSPFNEREGCFEALPRVSYLEFLKRYESETVEP